MRLIQIKATQCDDRYSKQFRTISNIKDVGIKVVFTLETEEEPTIDYMVKMCKAIENMGVIDHKYYINAKPIIANEKSIL